MRDIDIHKTFSKADVRDFFSESLYNLDIFNIPTGKTDITLKGIDYTIDSLEKKLVVVQEDLKRAKHKKAILTLMEVLGWEDFDVSERVSRTGNQWRNFIGTQEEHDTLINMIETCE